MSPEPLIAAHGIVKGYRTQAGYVPVLRELDLEVAEGEMLAIIGDYHDGLVPLIVPITLFRHYVRKYDVPWLKGQAYLDPHPLELKLRNHA